MTRIYKVKKNRMIVINRMRMKKVESKTQMIMITMTMKKVESMQAKMISLNQVHLEDCKYLRIN